MTIPIDPPIPPDGPFPPDPWPPVGPFPPPPPPPVMAFTAGAETPSEAGLEVTRTYAADAAVTTGDAATLNLVTDDDLDGKKSFIMTVHVDNNTCTAAVAKAQLSLSEANDCGVLAYDPDDMGETVTMPYTAFHPNGFATYRFRLKRGITTLPFTQNGTATPPGAQSQTATVAALTGPYPALSLPACPVAAFSEALHVWALATNGWSRLSGYDAFDHAAFVLAPEEEDTLAEIVISSETE